MNKRAFTLFELMIVIVIIGLIYTLVLGSFNQKDSIKITKFENIKDELIKYWKRGVKVELYIYDRCRESALFINNQLQDEIDIDLNIKLFQEIKIYKSDRFGQLREIKPPPVLIEEKIYKSCFKYTIFPNGSGSSFIAKLNNRYYTFFPYFENTYISKESNEALDKYLKKDLKISIVDE